MNTSKTIVVTSYGAWAKTATNPAAQVLQQVKTAPWGGHKLIPIELPVLTNDLFSMVDRTMEEHVPDIWLSIGVAPGAATMRIETVGTNWRDFDVPDNAGIHAVAQPVIADAPAAYNSTTPNSEIAAAINAAGIPATVSFSAGTHLCNQMLFTSRHIAEQRGLKTICGFLHVPYSPDHVVQHCLPANPQPSMALDMMVRATTITIEQCIEAAGGAE